MKRTILFLSLTTLAAACGGTEEDFSMSEAELLRTRVRTGSFRDVDSRTGLAAGSDGVTSQSVVNGETCTGHEDTSISDDVANLCFPTAGGQTYCCRGIDCAVSCTDTGSGHVWVADPTSCGGFESCVESGAGGGGGGGTIGAAETQGAG